MKSKKITEEELIRLLEIDDISRNKYLTKFIRIICNNGDNRIFSLDGNWGSGKTVFVKKLELLINYFSFYEEGEKIDNNNQINSSFEIKTESIQKMEILLSNSEYIKIKDMVKESCVNAIYFNAWEHDDEGDPIISIISEIIKKFDLLDSTKNVKSVSLSSNITSLFKFLNFGQVDLNIALNTENLSEIIELKDRIKDSLQTTLNDIINENCNKLVIFIDELDRCRPDYAINLLERLHHFLDDERVIIVLSTNIEELVNTISTKYGNGFSAEKYLDKFIDEHLFLPNVSIESYLKTFDTQLNLNSRTWVSIVITSFIKYNNLSMRQINQYIGCMNHFSRYLNETQIMMDENFKLVKFILLPYIVGLYTISPIDFKKFYSGHGYDKFKEFINSNQSIQKLIRGIIYSNEGISDIQLYNDLEKIYQLIFDKGNIEKISVDGQDVYKSEFNEIYNTISLLGDISEFKG